MRQSLERSGLHRARGPVRSRAKFHHGSSPLLLLLLSRLRISCTALGADFLYGLHALSLPWPPRSTKKGRAAAAARQAEERETWDCASSGKVRSVFMVFASRKVPSVDGVARELFTFTCPVRGSAGVPHILREVGKEKARA